MQLIRYMAKTNKTNRDKSKLKLRLKKNSSSIYPFTHSPTLLLNVCTTLCSKDRKTCKIHAGFKALTGSSELPKHKVRKL